MATPPPRPDTTTTPACNTLEPPPLRPPPKQPPPRPTPASGGFQPALRSVGFCSCYIYSPRGNTFVSLASRQLCARLKLGDTTWLPHYAGVVRELTTRHEALAELFGAGAVLVPVPGSDPSATRVWAAERLAVALHGVLLGKSVWPGVQRRFPVRKSATALNADRPTTQQHYESLSVSPLSGAPQRIVLIDDVITKGRTILAAAARLHEAFPSAYISAFALLRTMGFLSEVSRLLEPCKGFVRWAGGDARREP
jgi:predicted amidophosphoribosyltransferase